MGKFKLPPDHQPGMRVPKGGSSCAKCQFVSEDKKHCSSKYFQEWAGTDELPAPADEYCSDWFMASSEGSVDVREAFARALDRRK